MRSARTNHLLQRRSAGVRETEQSRRVLVVEDHPFVADPVAEDLREHEDVLVAWCRDGSGRVTCRGVVNAWCPLTDHVDLVLDVRTSSDGKLTDGEVGVACAGSAGIPVVVAGPTRPEPVDLPWAVATSAVPDAAGFCRQLLQNPGSWDELRLEDLVRRVLRMRSEDAGEVRVEMLRWPGALTVVVHSERGLSAATCSAVDREVRSLPGLKSADLRLSFAGP